MKKPDLGGTIKVIIADDHALFRAGVKTALSVKKDVELIGEADNGMQLLNLLKHMEPDVILLDIQMPIMDGITTLPEIRKLFTTPSKPATNRSSISTNSPIKPF
jgi:DNA-binding NarL/FixJ family response regulator